MHGLSILSFFMVLIRKSDVSHRSKAIKGIGVSERDCPMVTRYSNRVICHGGSMIRLIIVLNMLAFHPAGVVLPEGLNVFGMIYLLNLEPTFLFRTPHR